MQAGRVPHSHSNLWDLLPQLPPAQQPQTPPHTWSALITRLHGLSNVIQLVIG